MMEPPPTFEQPPEPSSIRLVLTLAVAGLVSGLAIVGAYELTLPTIEANNARALERAVFKVVPGSTRLQGLVIDGDGAHAAGADEAPDVYAAHDDAGSFKGYAIAAEGPGFQDVIRLIYGYDPTSRLIVGMDVLESRETPGLGDKIYKDQGFVGNFSALAVDPPIKSVKHGEKTAENHVDAITGATISSKAVVRIIAESNEFWLGQLPPADRAPAIVIEPDGEEVSP